MTIYEEEYRMATTIYEQMKLFFENDDWSYEELEDRPGISLRYAGQNGSFDCFAYAREDQSQFVFYAVCSMKAPEDRRMSVSEFITRANFGMIIGNFEMDFKTGEVRYKTAVDVEGMDLNFNLAKNAVYPAVLMMDKYFNGLMRVIYGRGKPQDVILEIEGE